MKKRFLAVIASFMLIFSAGMPLSTAKADDYGNIIDASENYDGLNGQSSNNTSAAAETATTENNTSKNILICIVIGFVIGGAVTLVKVSSMKSVHRQFGASDYKKPDSFKLDVSYDNFLYNRIEKTPLPQQSSNNNNSGQLKP